MKKFNLKTSVGLKLLVLTAVFAFPILSVSSVQAETFLTPPACPISAASGRVIVNFNGTRMLSGGPLVSGPVTASVPAGGYTVRVVSWDGYETRNTVSQAHEQWYATVENSSAVLAQTGTVSDLPDNVTQATVNEVINSATNPLIISSAGTKVTARHAYPSDTSSPNSVVPICISFDPIVVTPPACPIEAASGRIIVNFDGTTLLRGGAVVSGPVTAAIPAGSYKVRTVSWDGYPNRINTTQVHEQWYATVDNNSSILAQSGTTSDLPDMVIQATLDEYVNNTGNLFVVPTSGNKVAARHAYASTDTSSANSVKPICVSFDPVYPTLAGSCSVTPASGAIGEDFVWSASASGGNDPYTYSWSGTDSLSGTSASVTKSYTTAGTKNASVVITSGSQSITKNCSVTIETDPVIPACPIPPAANRTIINFDKTKRLCSYLTSTCNTSSGPVTAALTVGDYKVTLVSWDGYIGREIVSQPKEQWFVSVLGATTEIGTSDTIGDLADLVRTATLTDTVNNTGNLLTLATAGVSVTAKHAFLDPTKTSVANSVFPVCASFDKILPPPPSSATLKVIKIVVNDDGGTKTAADFSIHVKQSGTDVSGSPAAGSTSGSTYTLSAGSYVVSEDSVSGYTMTGISGDCSSSGSVSLVAGDSKVCTITNNDDNIPPPPPSFDGSCSVTPSSGKIGDIFTWSASASGGNDPYTYSWSGDESLTGSAATTTKSYTSTGTKNASVVITSGSKAITRNCLVTVDSNPPPPPPSFSASCSVSPRSASLGQKVTWSASVSGGTGTYTYEWTGTDGLSGTTATVEKSYGTTGSKNGSVLVTSGSNIVTASCSIDINPPPGCTGNCGGGGFNPPTVTLLKKAETLPLAFVYLSQVPYTGFGDVFKVVSFILGLLLWSVFVVYLIKTSMISKFVNNLKLHFYRRMRFAGNVNIAEVEAVGDDTSPITESPDYLKFIGVANNGNGVAESSLNRNGFYQVPANLPVDDDSDLVLEDTSKTVIDPRDRDILRETLAIRARQSKTLVSEDALNLFISYAVENGVEPNAKFDQLINDAEVKYLKEDGWILINNEKMKELIAELKNGGNRMSGSAPLRTAPIETPVRDVGSIIRNGAFVPTAAESASYALPRTEGSSVAADVSVRQFIRLLGDGRSDKIFEAIRAMRTNRKDLPAYIKSVIFELDQVLRARVEGMGSIIDPEVKSATAEWGNDELEEVITILLTIIDQSYKNSITGIKLAVMRVAELKKK